jgi:hypothetical protein
MNNYIETYVLNKKSIDNGRPVSFTEIKFEAIMLDDVVSELDRFLKACGFCYKGELQIVSEDENV